MTKDEDINNDEWPEKCAHRPATVRAALPRNGGSGVEVYAVQSLQKQVPYLPSCKDQTWNIMKLLDGRTGRLADLGSGDGRVVFAASSAGFKCTGFEINSILVAYARAKARWTALPSSQAIFVKKYFWKTDLSQYNNVTAFLATGVMEVLGEKLLKELPDDARVIACRYPFPSWPHQSTLGSGLNQTWAYDIGTVRSSLRQNVK
ncbi:ATP synthase subunit C lysine N-methyltransferase [Syngnathus typhle]|uniref:ATP synthase subunit C lysine N-methyltransferase n=1 Tax=Syngnathus typhle TaxID=161592 RepID=UPI002A6B6473|nr:ATP synthase subunit C lysine N-methyltransferase [Syngnathus typhle]